MNIRRVPQSILSNESHGALVFHSTVLLFLSISPEGNISKSLILTQIVSFSLDYSRHSNREQPREEKARGKGILFGAHFTAHHYILNLEQATFSKLPRENSYQQSEEAQKDYQVYSESRIPEQKTNKKKQSSKETEYKL